MKSNKPIIVLAIVLGCISLALVLYPTASQLINKMFDKGSIVTYNNQVSVLDATTKSEMLSQAQIYNENLLNTVNISDSFSSDAYEVKENYEDILSVTDDGLIGTVSIPVIDCNLPVYHGTSEEMLKKGAVHMANTSFPIGGESTHSVVSAHTAYPGKEFFNRLTELKVGDYFYFKVLGNTIAYKVCQIDVVLPDETELLSIEKGQDYATLITCTPYSVNTHRLLVRGQRDLQEEKRLQLANGELSTDITPVKHTILYIGIVVTVLIIFVVVLIIKRKKRKEENGAENSNCLFNYWVYLVGICAHSIRLSFCTSV